MFDIFQNRTLQVEVTTACNLECDICLRKYRKGPGRFLSLVDFKRILNHGLFRYVGLHGWGEPLLNRYIFEMVKFAGSKGVITNLTTNGTLLHERMGEIFGSGLKEIAFGIYDPNLLSNVLPFIEEFVKERNKKGLKDPKTYFDITLYKTNRFIISDLIRLASDIGIEAVILHRLFDPQDVESETKCLLADDEKKLFKEIKRIARSLNIELYLPGKHTCPCLIVQRSIFVTVTGKVTPCTYLLEEYIGDAFHDGVKGTLRSRGYKDFVKNMKQHPICSKCRW